MNDNNDHWYLCVIDLISEGCIYIFDSLPNSTRQDIRTKNVKIVVLFFIFLLNNVSVI